MNQELLIGIDLGTSLTKVGVFTTDGTVVRLQSAPTPITWDGPQEAHHDPEALWAVVAQLIQQTVLGLEPSRLVSIGISSFGEAGVLLDADGAPRTSVLAWFDTRPKRKCDQLLKSLDLRDLRRRTGLMADHTYSLFKLLWLQDQISLEHSRWISVTDWIAFKLTGRAQMGVTQASRTLLFDLERPRWLEDIVRDLGLPLDVLPPLRLPGEGIGLVTTEAASITGLPEGLPVMESAHDQPCAAAGVGATEAGVLLNACGTAEILFTTLEQHQLGAALAAESVSIGPHAFPDRYWVMASLRASGSVFDWFVRMIESAVSGAAEITPEGYERVIGAAREAQTLKDGIAFIPHLRQLSEDPSDPSLPGGVFLGLRETHGLGDLARAVLEGLSLESERLLERVQQAIGQIGPTALIRAVGGPTRNAIWMQRKADLYGLPFEVYAAPNATTWGAAWLAWYHLNASQGTPISSSLTMPSEMIYRPLAPAEDSQRLKDNYRTRVALLARALGPEPGGEEPSRGSL